MDEVEAPDGDVNGTGKSADCRTASGDPIAMGDPWPAGDPLVFGDPTVWGDSAACCHPGGATHGMWRPYDVGDSIVWVTSWLAWRPHGFMATSRLEATCSLWRPAVNPCLTAIAWLVATGLVAASWPAATSCVGTAAWFSPAHGRADLLPFGRTLAVRPLYGDLVAWNDPSLAIPYTSALP